MSHLSDARIWFLVAISNAFALTAAVIAAIAGAKTEYVVGALTLFVYLETFVAILWYTIETRKIQERMTKQLSQVSLSQQQTTYGDLYAQQQQITQFFAANIKLRPHFYENVEIATSDPNYHLAMFIAEMLADFFEHLYLELDTLPKDIADGWRLYAALKYKNSPPFRIYIQDRKDLYGDGVLRMLGAPP